MKHFADLVPEMVLTKGVDDFSAPGQQQREAAEAFPLLLSTTGLHLWTADQPGPDQSRLVIGVATWSRPDMKLLDELILWAPALERIGVRIEVFNVYGFESLKEFDIRIPGLGTVYHTPVVGIWENGLCEQRASGHAARVLISSYIRRQAEKSLDRLLETALPAVMVAAE